MLSPLPYRAAEAVLKGQVETIVSFHIQNISNSKTERSTAPLVCPLEKALRWEGSAATAEVGRGGVSQRLSGLRYMLGSLLNFWLCSFWAITQDQPFHSDPPFHPEWW